MSTDPEKTTTKFDLGGRRAPLGEPQVWLCSMGLALGMQVPPKINA